MISYLFRSSAVLAILFVGATALPSSLRAQLSAVADRDTAAQSSPAPPAAGPRIAPAGVTRLAAPIDLARSPRENDGVHAGSDLAMMGVGGAAVVIGLLIGGDVGTVVAISGGVFGLIGLYRYLR
jgi:hypothetical protein